MHDESRHAFDKSVSKATNDLPLLLQNFHISNVETKQCYVLKPFLNPQ